MWLRCGRCLFFFLKGWDEEGFTIEPLPFNRFPLKHFPGLVAPPPPHWKINGWNLRKFSPGKGKNHLNQTIIFRFYVLIFRGLVAPPSVIQQPWFSSPSPNLLRGWPPTFRSLPRFFVVPKKNKNPGLLPGAWRLRHMFGSAFGGSSFWQQKWDTQQKSKHTKYLENLGIRTIFWGQLDCWF